MYLFELVFPKGNKFVTTIDVFGGVTHNFIFMYNLTRIIKNVIDIHGRVCIVGNMSNKDAENLFPS